MKCVPLTASNLLHEMVCIWCTLVYHNSKLILQISPNFIHICLRMPDVYRDFKRANFTFEIEQAQQKRFMITISCTLKCLQITSLSMYHLYRFDMGNYHNFRRAIQCLLPCLILSPLSKHRHAMCLLLICKLSFSKRIEIIIKKSLISKQEVMYFFQHSWRIASSLNI